MALVNGLMAKAAELLASRRGQCLIFVLFLDKDRNTDQVLCCSDETADGLRECLDLGMTPIAFWVWPFHTAEFVPVSGAEFSIEDQAVINGLYVTEGEGPGYCLLPFMVDQPGRRRPKPGSSS